MKRPYGEEPDSRAFDIFYDEKISAEEKKQKLLDLLYEDDTVQEPMREQIRGYLEGLRMIEGAGEAPSV